MSQTKYLAQAFLLLVVLVAVGLIIDKFSSVEFVAEKQTVTDYVEKTKPQKLVVNTEGKKLFEDNCQVCHALDKTDNLDFERIETHGPWVDRKNLIAWIKNPAATIPKFQYTKDLVEQYNGQMMPSFPRLTDAQIEAILDYLKSYSFYSTGVSMAL